MDNNDTAMQGPSCGNGTMDNDDIAFVQGYADAVAWLPSANPEEVEQFLADGTGENCFEMYENHTFAKYKGWTGREPYGLVGLFGAKTNDSGVEVGYTAGIVAALQIHRPDAYRAVRKMKLGFKRERIELIVEQFAEQLARAKADLDAVDAELATI